MEIENDGRVGRVGERVTRLAMAIMLLATVAIAVVYFAGPGLAQSEQSQGNGEGLTSRSAQTRGVVLHFESNPSVH